MAEEYGRPNYGECDGLVIAKHFSVEAFRSAINYKPKPGDLFVVTYPKCGTTWVQCIVMLILRKGRPFKTQREFLRNSPYLDLTGADAVHLMEGPGAIKLHLPLHLTPFSPEAKYIYVARNPKDCCVSFYYHTKIIPFYNFEDGTFEEFFELFISGRTDYGDYFDHLLPWYERRNDPNVYFVTYEELKKDTKSQVSKIARFIGEEHYERLKNNPKELEDVLHYSSFDIMKKQMGVKEEEHAGDDVTLASGVKAINEYIAKNPKMSKRFRGDLARKGVVGDWKNHFTSEQEQRMEEWIKRKTEGSDVMSLWSGL